MLKQLTILSLLLTGSSTALADASQDCEKLNGDAAIQACSEAIRRNPRDALSYYNRGVQNGNKQDLDRAIADYNMAIEIEPKFAAAIGNRGNIHARKGDFDRAIADSTKAIDIDPENPNPYGTRAFSYGAKGDFGRSLADYTKAIEVDPKLAAAYNNRAYLRAKFNRDLPLALSDADTAIKLRPNNPTQLDTRGFVYLRLNRLDEAIRDYDAALKIDPGKATSLYGRGLAKRKSGDRAGGDADIAAAKSIKASIADEFVKYGVN